MNKRDLLQRAIQSPNNLRFTEMCALAEAFDFRLARTRGSHHIDTHRSVRELVNLQNVGGKAKPYQVRQFLRLIERYNLLLVDEP